MSPADDFEVREADFGGDPVCWLDRVCPECGAFLTDGAHSTCPRCDRIQETE